LKIGNLQQGKLEQTTQTPQVRKTKYSSKVAADNRQVASPSSGKVVERRVEVEGSIIKHQSFLNPNFTFDTFVEGKSNQLARAASVQIAENPGGARWCL